LGLQVNKLGMPLYTLAVVDWHGCGLLVIQGLLYREDHAHITTFLPAAKKLATDSNVNLARSIFLVNKDMAEIAALRTVPWTDYSTVPLSAFHVMRALLEELKKLTIDIAESE